MPATQAQVAGGPRGAVPGVGGTPAAGYDHIRELLGRERCVLLDGGIATELAGEAANHVLDEGLWGTGALIHRPGAVLDVHRSYLRAGCDVITTNTWGLPSGLAAQEAMPWGEVHWMDVARAGVRLARTALGECARPASVAFSLNGDVAGPEGAETVGLLERAFRDEPPDLVLLETLSLVNPETSAVIERLVATGLPVWVSFRRCRDGLCGVYGQHWGGPEGDRFGRVAHRLEEMGVAALLVNCIPPDHVSGMVPWLRDFTDLPLGVYPNLGYLTEDGWQFATDVGGDEYAAMAAQWRDEGAQIVGGCCGVGPEHIAAAGRRLDGTRPGHCRPEASPRPAQGNGSGAAAASSSSAAWVDGGGRSVYPLAFPDIACDQEVFVPTQGSFLLWRHLFTHGIGAGRRCLDIGCGTGLLSVQLALNGATSVLGIDIDPGAVANTKANAFRNGVPDRVASEVLDLYPWVPHERWEVIVASLFQMPVDPFEQTTSHRPVDYWGRNLVDHLLAKLPDALAPGGVAYVMQLSILGRERTDELLAEHGLRGRVADFAFFPFTPIFEERMEQIERVEGQSDAFHLDVGGERAMVAYLLEITHAGLHDVP